MIRKSPAEYYIKYLTLHPSKHTNEDIKLRLEQQQLDCPGEDYIEAVRTSCVVPAPFYPTDPLHTKSQRFLYKEKVQKMFAPDSDMKIALQLLNHARAKEFIEAMALSGAPPALIANALGTHRGVFCTEKAVQYYKHFFWNTDLVDSSELRALLQMRAPEADQVNDPKKKGQAKALNKAFKTDPRMVAASLPNSPLVAMMSQMRMGFMPRNINLADIIDATRKMATLRTLEATMLDGPFDSKKALEFSVVAKNMTEMLETVVRPDEKMREELATIALKTEEGPVPYIHELSEGSHTVELSPKEIPNEPSGNKPGSDEGPAELKSAD